MKITEKEIPLIEKALGFSLYPWQVEWLLEDKPMPMVRGNGKTVARCIKLALGDFEDYIYIYTSKHSPWAILIKSSDPININEMEGYSDYGDGLLRYARGFFRNLFLDTWLALKEAGLPVIELERR